MDFVEVDRIIKSHGFDSEPAFTNVYVSVSDIPQEMNALGLYYPNEQLIVIPPNGEESVFIHELGHRYGHFYFNNLTEEFAEEFRKRYEYNSVHAFGRDISYIPFKWPADRPVYQIGDGAAGILPLLVSGAVLGVSYALSRRR
jgi:hypothetical protein